MTSEDDSSLSEDEIDEIVDRVVDRLQSAGVGDDDSDGEPRSDDETRSDDDPDGERIEVKNGEETDRDRSERAARARERARRKKEQAKRAKDRAKDRAQRGPEPPDPPRGTGHQTGRDEWDEREWNAFGDKMEAFGRRMEEFGERLGREIEASVAAIDFDEIERQAERTADSGLGSLNVTPEAHTRTAIYKSQLQKGGRIAVPDPEIEALGIEPGDTLQVVLFPIGRADDEAEPPE